MRQVLRIFFASGAVGTALPSQRTSNNVLASDAATTQVYGSGYSDASRFGATEAGHKSRPPGKIWPFPAPGCHGDSSRGVTLRTIGGYIECYAVNPSHGGSQEQSVGIPLTGNATDPIYSDLADEESARPRWGTTLPVSNTISTRCTMRGLQYKRTHSGCVQDTSPCVFMYGIHCRVTNPSNGVTTAI
jgi:hypothetical protein